MAFLLYFLLTSPAPHFSIKEPGIQTPTKWLFWDISLPSSWSASSPNKLKFLASTPLLWVNWSFMKQSRQVWIGNITSHWASQIYLCVCVCVCVCVCLVSYKLALAKSIFQWLDNNKSIYHLPLWRLNPKLLQLLIFNTPKGVQQEWGSLCCWEFGGTGLCLC